MTLARVVRCLGKLPARLDPRTLLLKSLMPELPAPPMARDWLEGLPDDLGMMLNDQIGDCTAASAAHLVQVWTKRAGGSELTISDRDVVAFYSAGSGYTPSDPASDQGADMLTMLNLWRKTGIGGHRIGAFAKVDHTDVDHVKAAIDYFGGLYCGAMLPISAQDVSKPWSGKPSPSGDDAPGTWGGHCIPVCAYDRSGATCVTWGARQRLDWQWWSDYVDECYAIVSADWLASSGEAPVGLPIEALQMYLSELEAA